MTLIIAWARHGATGIAVDQRLTLPDGTLCDDYSSKLLTLGVKGDRSAIAFEGLGFLGSPLQRTDLYLFHRFVASDLLRRVKSYRELFESIEQDLRDGVVTSGAMSDAERRLTIVGCTLFANGNTGLFRISNYLDAQGKAGPVQTSFATTSVHMLKEHKATMGAWGARKALLPSICRRLRRNVGPVAIQKMRPLQITEHVANAIRAASRVPIEKRFFISPHCQSITMEHHQPGIVMYHGPGPAPSVLAKGVSHVADRGMPSTGLLVYYEMDQPTTPQGDWPLLPGRIAFVAASS